MCVSPFSSSLWQFLSTNKLDAKSQVHVRERVCTVFISWNCVTIYATPFLRYHHEEVNRKAPNMNNNSNDDDDDHNKKSKSKKS